MRQEIIDFIDSSEYAKHDEAIKSMLCEFCTQALSPSDAWNVKVENWFTTWARKVFAIELEMVFDFKGGWFSAKIGRYTIDKDENNSIRVTLNYGPSLGMEHVRYAKRDENDYMNYVVGVFVEEVLAKIAKNYATKVVQ